MTHSLAFGNPARLLPAAFVLMTLSAPAMAGWKAASEDVATAAKDPRIAAALAAVDAADAALVRDDHAGFAALLAPDLVVNNPQNGVSVRGATGRRNIAGLISYSRYERSIEYAGTRGEFVLLMGDEFVVPKGDAPMAGQQVRRRFTDLWKIAGGHWVLAVRQATIVAPAGGADQTPVSDADASHQAHRNRVSCQPLGQHQAGDVGCYIVTQEPIGTVPTGPLYWHLDTFPDSAAARAGRGGNGSIVEAYGQVWLLTVAGKRWQPQGGHHVATIGPFRPLTTGPQTAAYMVATSTADMDSPPHTHPGPEAFYVVDGAQCLETPDGIRNQKAGEGTFVAGGVPMKLYGAGDTPRKALVLVLHDAAQPVVNRNPDWQPTDACLAGN